MLEKRFINHVSKNSANKYFYDLAAIKYTTNDLIFMNKPSRLIYISYLLLKLKFDKIIEYSTIASSDNTTETACIKFNQNLTYSDFKKYCDEFPETKIITNLIIQKNSLDDGSVLTIHEVFNSLKEDIKYQAENTKLFEKIYCKFATLISVTITIRNLLIFLPAISKIIMGITNSKPTSNLSNCVFILWFILLLVGKTVRNYTTELKIKEYLVIPINHTYFKPYTKNEFVKLIESDDELSESEKENLLKTLISSEHDFIKSIDWNTTFAGSVFTTMLAMELAQKNSSSSSGCGGCGGGCGGCGGGCGGCGD